MPIYSKFQFNYQGYRKLVTPLMEEIEQGRFESLYAQVNKVTKSTVRDQWVLHARGTDLFPVMPIEQPNVSQIGYCMLVILSTFLRPIKELPTTPAILCEALAEIGWDESDISQLIFGDPIVSILRPDLSLPTKDWRNLSTPYWHWIRPEQSMRCGWLTLEKILEFVSRLEQAHELLLSVDARISSNFTKSHWPYTEKGPGAMVSAYEETKSGFQTAISNNCGLYFVFS